MTPEKFNEVFDKMIEEMKETLCTKGNEYAFENDRLFNFKQAARINNQPVPQAIWGMAMKHLVSVIDIIDGRLENNIYNRNEKIGDLINYLILLKAALIEIEIGGISYNGLCDGGCIKCKQQGDCFEKESISDDK